MATRGWGVGYGGKSARPKVPDVYTREQFGDLMPLISTRMLATTNFLVIKRIHCINVAGYDPLKGHLWNTLG